MPHFRLETNLPQNKIPSDLPQKLCVVLSQSIGKQLNRCVATVIGGANMSWGGSNEPTAQATLTSIGGLGVVENKNHSEALYDIVARELHIPPNRMYIHYINANASDVGYNGTTFYELKKLN